MEYQGSRALFDTGASPLVGRNADALGLQDAVVLSHGHHDHAGGLAEVLKRAKGGVPLHLRPGFFRRRVQGAEPGSARTCA